MFKSILFYIAIPILFISISHAATWEPLSLVELTKKADVVLYGSVASTQSMINDGSSRLDNESILPSVQTILTVENLDVVTNSGLVPVGRSASLYLDGGIVKMPERLKRVYPKYQYFGVLNSAVPIFQSEPYERFFLFICKNGEAVSPFCNGSDGVFPVDLNGIVRNTSGQRLLGFKNGELMFDHISIDYTPTVNTEPSRPQHLDREGAHLEQLLYVTAEEFVDFIKSHTPIAHVGSDTVQKSINPNSVSSYFQKK